MISVAWGFLFVLCFGGAGLACFSLLLLFFYHNPVRIARGDLG